MRYSRVAPVLQWCAPRTLVTVQSAEKRIPHTSPAAFAGKNNPCGVSPEDLRRALKRYQTYVGVFETISFGIVAECDGESRVLELPDEESVDMRGFKKAYPAFARLWDFPEKIHSAAFGPKDIFQDHSDDVERFLQEAGEKIVPELRSGRFDPGLIAAVRGNVGNWKRPSFRSLLDGYRGPVAASRDDGPIPKVVLENGKIDQFSRFVAPIYPPLAKQARIQGNVELTITIDPTTGAVTDASVVAGHTLLKESALYAARQWQLVPGSLGSGTIRVTVEYSLECP